MEQDVIGKADMVVILSVVVVVLLAVVVVVKNEKTVSQVAMVSKVGTVV